MKADGRGQKHTHGSVHLMYRGRVLVDDEQGRWHAVVQLRRHGQRVEVEQVVLDVHPGHTLDVASWRGFPIAEVEATVNLPHYRRLIDEHWDSPDPPDDATLPIAVRKRPLRIGRYTPPPDGIRRYPDSHYQRVADTYTLHVEHGQPPAKRMSEDWGVPVSSINRWTKEARRRGLLAPARSRGRAG